MSHPSQANSLPELFHDFNPFHELNMHLQILSSVLLTMGVREWLFLGMQKIFAQI